VSAPRTWGQWRSTVAQRLAAGGIETADVEARRLCESASGSGGADWLDGESRRPTGHGVATLEAMVERRLSGEPLQYVLGSWSFRGLDLMVDARVLIPRPETEWVVECALEEAERLGLRRGTRAPFDARDPSVVVADLGTGSGAIGLALEAELPDAEVWATDVSEEALLVARANVAGCGATRVRVAQGSWFDALPERLRGRIGVVVSNPPYVSEPEVDTLPAEVADHEPLRALVSGPTGLEALQEVVAASVAWLAEAAVLVCEIAPHQAAEVIGLARDAGFREPLVRADLTGRDRVLIARSGGVRVPVIRLGDAAPNAPR